MLAKSQDVKTMQTTIETMHMGGFTAYILWLHGQY